MVHHCESHVIFQVIEDQPQKNILHHFHHRSFLWNLHQIFRTSILNTIQNTLCCIICDPTHQMYCMKYLKVSCCLFLKFWRNVLRTVSKRTEKTSVGWHPWDVPMASILTLSSKCILIAFFSILFQQICLKQ